jgi:hypothetical protein
VGSIKGSSGGRGAIAEIVRRSCGGASRGAAGSRIATGEAVGGGSKEVVGEKKGEHRGTGEQWG